MNPTSPRPMRWRVIVHASVLAWALPAPACADDDTARSLAATCTGCHGTEGRARDAAAVLAGMPADRMLALLGEVRSGARPATVMHQIVKGYTGEQLRMVAEWFAARSR